MPVSADPLYRHGDKQIVPGLLLTTGGRRLKWYDIGTQELPVPAEIHAMARNFLARTNLEQLSELGFPLLHRCGPDFYFLLACSWQGNNEIWESVYAKDA